MNRALILIKTNNKYLLTNYLMNNFIFYEIKKENNNKYILEIEETNLKLIKKKYKVKIIKYYGIKGIRLFLNKNCLFLISVIWALIILFSLSNTIFSVDIISDNKIIKDMLTTELDSFNIRKYGKVVKYKDLVAIKEEILNNNAESLEWLEINRIGTKYQVFLTERVIAKKEINDETPRNLIASKDALIKNISSSSGEVVKEINEYVKKGETIISGYIYKNDKIMGSVKSNGIVYGEVWYTAKTTVPFKYIEYVRTGKIINHVYIESFGNKMTLFGKYETTSSMRTVNTLIDKPYLGFKLLNEKKEIYEYKEFKITEDEAIEEAKKRSEKSIINKLSDKERIIDKKVLNIHNYGSKIEVEIFYKVYENITDYELIEGNFINEE